MRAHLSPTPLFVDLWRALTTPTHTPKHKKEETR